MNALILVDIQNDFIPGGSLAVPAGDEIIPLVNDLQNAFELIVATQDWHPQNHKSFASNHIGKDPFQSILLHGMDQMLWPDHCIQGAPGAEFSARLNMNKVEGIFRKGMDPEIDSYSGFYDNGYKRSTGLAGYLRERKVTRLFLCGLAGDYCVFFTAKDALKENFDTYLIDDAIRSIDSANYEKAKNEILTAGGQVVRSEMLYRHL